VKRFSATTLTTTGADHVDDHGPHRLRAIGQKVIPVYRGDSMGLGESQIAIVDYTRRIEKHISWMRTKTRSRNLTKIFVESVKNRI
jgi:hypothetical protein